MVSSGSRLFGTSARRGASDVVSVVLVLAVVIAGMISVLVLGISAFDSTGKSAELERAEHTMTLLDSRSAMVALGSSERQSVQFGQGSGQIETDPSAGWMQLSIRNTSSGAVDVPMNVTLGAVRYRNGDETIAYQGGGVWRTTSGSGSRMISAPEFHYHNSTLTLPAIVVDGTTSTSSTVSIRRNGSVRHVYPNASEGNLNPLENGEITVTVQSDYYEAWGTYFEQRTEGGVTYDHDRRLVNVTLLQPDSRRRVSNGLRIGGGNGDLQIQSGHSSVIDSYNSSALAHDLGPGSSPSASGTDGDIVTSLDIEMTGQAQIEGSLTTTGNASIPDSGGHNPYVQGYLSYGKSGPDDDACDHSVAQECAQNATSTGISGATVDIQNILDSLGENHENDDESCISRTGGLDWGSCGSPITLSAGSYYVNESDFSVGGNQKLILDTTDGDVTIGVDDDHGISIGGGGGANLTVTGNGTARIYGQETIDVKKSDTTVWNRGWDAEQMWLYCTADCDVTLQNGDPTYVGAIYAPASPGNTSGQTQIRNSAEVFGGVVGSGGGSDAKLVNSASIHFDEALRGAEVFEDPVLPEVSYLHVSVNRITLESG